MKYCLLFFTFCIVLSCPKAETEDSVQNGESSYNNIPVDKILEDFGGVLDVSNTLKSYGGFYNPTKNTPELARNLIRVLGINQSHYTVDRASDDDDATKINIVNKIYGFDNKKDITNWIFHTYYFYLYKCSIDSPIIAGNLFSAKDPSTKTVIVHGDLQFWHLNTETNVEKKLNLYFGNDYKNGNNGGIVFDENNAAISGTLIIQSFIRLEGMSFEEYYNNPNPNAQKKEYNIEVLTDIEHNDLKKLNLFDIAPPPQNV